MSCVFMISSWRVTLPSNTMLPTRAMTPPMMAGSTCASIYTVPPVARPSAADNPADASVVSGTAVVTWA